MAASTLNVLFLCISKAEGVLKKCYPAAVCEFKEGRLVSETGCTVVVTELTAEAMIARFIIRAFRHPMALR